MEGRYSVQKENTHSISYITHPVFTPVKMLLGFIAIDYFNKHGITGWYREKSRLAQRIGDQMPYVPDLFKKLHQGVEDMGTTFTKRGAFCIPKDRYKQGKNELATLRHMAVTYAGVEDLFQNSTKVCCEEQLMEWQETVILMTCEPGPCVYLRTNMRMPNVIYVGESGNQLERNKGHSNSPLYLSKLWTVANKDTARAVQNHGLQYLRTHCQYTKTGDGWFTTNWDNAGEHMEKWMEANYGYFFHNRGIIPATS